MMEEVKNQEPTEVPKEEAPKQDIKAVLAELMELKQRIPKSEPKEEEPAAPEAKAALPALPTAPPVAPTAPAGRVTRKQYDELADWGVGMRQRLVRLELAQEFGLEPADMEGDFETPQAMRHHAELSAIKREVVALKQALEGSTDEGEETPLPPEVPQADTGGPTGRKSAQDVALEAQYAAARAKGRTPKGRVALLEALYNDPNKRSSRKGTRLGG